MAPTVSPSLGFPPWAARAPVCTSPSLPGAPARFRGGQGPSRRVHKRHLGWDVESVGAWPFTLLSSGQAAVAQSPGEGRRLCAN